MNYKSWFKTNKQDKPTRSYKDYDEVLNTVDDWSEFEFSIMWKIINTVLTSREQQLKMFDKMNQKIKEFDNNKK